VRGYDVMKKITNDKINWGLGDEMDALINDINILVTPHPGQ